MIRSSPVPFALYVIFISSVPFCLGAVEQTLLIDLAKRHSANGQQFEEAEGVENLLTITNDVKETKKEAEPSEKLDETVSSLRKMFSQRFDHLLKRIEMIEANQRNFMKGTDWAAKNEGKSIRLFSEERNWTEAQNMCAKINGSLLKINSEEKRRTIGELLKNTADSLWWIGVLTAHFSHWAYNDETEGNLNNGEEDEQKQRKSEGTCTALTVEKWGESAERECDEKHKFICQIWA